LVLDHPLINSARSFFNEKAYEHSVGSYTGRVFSSFEKHVTVSDLLEGKYKAIETGSEAFKRFHSDYIYHYYKNNNIRTESTVKALAYALENNSSELSLEKAMLLIEAINGNELIQSVEQPISTTNSEAWRLVGLLTSGEESDPQDKVKLISDLATMNASEADTRIAAIKLLNVVGKVTQENIALIEQNQIEKDYLRFLGVEDEDDDAALIKLAIELVAGKHFDFFQQLIEKGDMHAADHLTSIVIDHLPEIDDKKLARNMDIDVVYSYVDFATENDTYYYYLENTVLVLEKHDKNRLQEWAKSQLQKSRHRWSNQRSISDTANYVDMFRKIVRGEL